MGAIEECTAYIALVERLFRSDPGSADSRRGALIASTKMAELRGMRGERDSAQVYYRRAERLALEAVAALPNNTDASRDLSIVYGAHGLFLAEGNGLDSALAVYDRGMRIAEDLAAQDPDSFLQQADVAAGHHEIGTMLMKGRRYPEAERRFEEAFRRYNRLAASDTANAEARVFMARSARGAGDASRALSLRRGSSAERSRDRARALTWWGRSLDLYRGLARDNFYGTFNLGGPTRTSAGFNDVFVAKFDPDGAYEWSKRFGDSNDQFASSVTTDADENVIITGWYSGAIDIGGDNLVSAGASDIFVAKLDQAGDHLWSRRFGDVNDQSAYSVAVDASQNVIVAGGFYGTVDFGGGPLTSAGGLDLCLVKFDAAGTHQWSRRFSGNPSRPTRAET